jgi:hypothetical protein
LALGVDIFEPAHDPGLVSAAPRAVRADSRGGAQRALVHRLDNVHEAHYARLASQLGVTALRRARAGTH